MTGSELEVPRYAPVRLCSGKGAYEAIPEPPAQLDLDRVAHSLEASGSQVTHARVMLIVRSEPEVTLSRDGRILVKTKDPKAAERAVRDVWLRIRGHPAGSR